MGGGVKVKNGRAGFVGQTVVASHKFRQLLCCLSLGLMPFLRSEGIFKFMSVNSTCSCPTTMLALTSPPKYSKWKSVWTDKRMDGHVKRHGQVVLLPRLQRLSNLPSSQQV